MRRKLIFTTESTQYYTDVNYRVNFVPKPGASANNIYIELINQLTTAIKNGVFESNLRDAAIDNNVTGLSQVVVNKNSTGFSSG